MIAVSATRDLAASVSPWLSLRMARDGRSRILAAFAADETRTARILAAAAADADREATSFSRLEARIRHASDAVRERDRAMALVEAYKIMAEGHTRRWVTVLLQLAGLDTTEATVGKLAEPAAAHLGEIGARLGSALLPAVRNAEAHEDFDYDDDRGVLLAGDAKFTWEAILVALTDLDVLQRGWIAGRLAAFADRPELGKAFREHETQASRAAALTFAKLRLGHAGQRIRSLHRDRDVLEMELEGLRPETCNPCLLGLTQTSAMLPGVTRFVVRVPGRHGPVFDLPASVLHANLAVLSFALPNFEHCLPPVTFLPCLAYTRLAAQSVPQAAVAAAWLALNDCQYAVIGDPRWLGPHLRLVAAAAQVTAAVLPPGDHLAPLVRAQRVAETSVTALSADADGVATDVLLDRFLRLRDRLGPAPAVLPTLDDTPLVPSDQPPGFS